MLGASSGVVRLGAVASGYRHIASPEQSPILANSDGNCGVSQHLWIYPACEPSERGGMQIIDSWEGDDGLTLIDVEQRIARGLD